LLPDLPQRRLLGLLARLQLSLGQRPVVLARTVDHGDLDPASRAPMADDPSGRSDQGPDAGYGSLIHARSRGWSSLCQALGHLARARSASASSRAAISPATKDRRPDPAWARSQARALTLSWWSPSTVCRLAAALAKRSASTPTA